MSASFNKVLLIGNLVRDAELRYTTKGTCIASITIAVNRQFKSEGGDKKEEITFVQCDAWARQAEVLGQYAKKGTPIHIEGRLTLSEWTDKTTQQKRSALKVTIENFQFLSSRNENTPSAPTAIKSAALASAPVDDSGDSVPF